MDLKDAILTVLKKAEKPLTNLEITQLILDAELIDPGLKAPGNQIYETIARDIRTNPDTPFVRVEGQMFAMRVWQEPPPPVEVPQPQAATPVETAETSRSTEPDAGMNWLDAAMLVLDKAQAPLTTEEIAKRIIDQRLLTTQSKDPENNVYSRLMDDVRRRGDESPLVKVSSRVFGLRSWGLVLTKAAEIRPRGRRKGAIKLSPVERAPKAEFTGTPQEAIQAIIDSWDSKSYLRAAREAILKYGHPISAKDMVAYALKKSLIKPATDKPLPVMYARLADEIKKHADHSVFLRVERGLFALRENVDAPDGPIPQAPVTRRKRTPKGEVSDGITARQRPGGLRELAIHILQEANRALTPREVYERAIASKLLIHTAGDAVSYIHRALVRYSKPKDKNYAFLAEADGTYQAKPDLPILQEVFLPVRFPFSTHDESAEAPVPTPTVVPDAPKRGRGRPKAIPETVESTPEPITRIISLPIAPLPDDYRHRVIAERVADLLYLFAGANLSIYRPLDPRDPFDLLVSPWGETRTIRVQVHGVFEATRSGGITLSVPSSKVPEDENVILVFCYFDREDGELAPSMWIAGAPAFLKAARKLGVDRRGGEAQYTFNANLDHPKEGPFGGFSCERKTLATILLKLLGR